MTTTELQPWQQRVIEEEADVHGRLTRLLAHFQTDLFAGLPEAERVRQRNQARFMDGYAAVLAERIAAFQAEAPAAKRYTRDHIKDFHFMDNALKGGCDVGIVMHDGSKFIAWVGATCGEVVAAVQKRGIEAALRVANGELP